jgi:hypothetical protein
MSLGHRPRDLDRRQALKARFNRSLAEMNRAVSADLFGPQPIPGAVPQADSEQGAFGASNIGA